MPRKQLKKRATHPIRNTQETFKVNWSQSGGRKKTKKKGEAVVAKH